MAKVTIVGSGFIGRAWAITFARAGHQVTLWDENPAAPEAAVEFARTVLPDLALDRSGTATYGMSVAVGDRIGGNSAVGHGPGQARNCGRAWLR